MTPSEFKAWFDGFTEAFDKTPTKAQWERVKARVAEIDGKPVTERVYVDRYWPLYQRYYATPTYPSWSTVYCQNTAGGLGVGAAGQASSGTTYLSASLSNSGAIGNQPSHGTMTFDGASAMAALGRAEATELARA